MASSEIPTLRITNEELQKRGKQITSSGDDLATKYSSLALDEKGEKSTPGLLYLSPTTVVNTNNQERKTKRTKGRTQHKDTSRPPKISANSIRQEGRHIHAINAQQSQGESARHKGPSHRPPNQSVCEERQGKGTTKLKHECEEDVLKAEWSHHENRKIERALAKWYDGDITKLDPVIQTW